MKKHPLKSSLLCNRRGVGKNVISGFRALRSVISDYDDISVVDRIVEESDGCPCREFRQRANTRGQFPVRYNYK